MRKQQNRWTLLLGTGAVVAAAGTLSAAALLNPVLRMDGRHCVIDRVPKRTLVVGIDVSDALVVAQPREVAYRIEQGLATLSKGDRVLVLDTAGKPPSEVEPVIDTCHPGAGTNVARNAFNKSVLGPVSRHLDEVKSRPASPESPLAETVIGIVSDPSLHASGTQLTIQLHTDGLQNTELQSAYRSGSKFPKLEGAPLKGVTIDLNIVPNTRDMRLQPGAVDRLVTWLKESGATVQFTPPGWLVLEKARAGGGTR